MSVLLTTLPNDGPASWLKTRSNTPFPYLPDLSNRCRTAAISR